MTIVRGPAERYWMVPLPTPATREDRPPPTTPPDLFMLAVVRVRWVEGAVADRDQVLTAVADHLGGGDMVWATDNDPDDPQEGGYRLHLVELQPGWVTDGQGSDGTTEAAAT